MGTHDCRLTIASEKRRRMRRASCALIVLAAIAAALPGVAAAEQSSQPNSPAAGLIETGEFHSCAVVSSGLRCWGYGGHGALGLGDTASIGDDETPASAAPVDLGSGVAAIGGGSVHTCALLAGGTVRCWGFGGDGRLGYRSVDSLGHVADKTPAVVGPVDLGGRPAKAITAGDGHTCVVLDDGAVRCWGFNLDGRLGYGHTDSVGDDELPGSAGPVKFGPGLSADAVSAGGFHTCALLDDGGVRCWGFGGNGRLGYGNVDNVARTPSTTPDAIGAVDLAGRFAKAVSAGYGHTCAILDDGTVRCWGYGALGRLGYGNANAVGDDETPGTVSPVDLGTGRTAKAISAGFDHTCAVLDDGSVRCWGAGGRGQLGYGDGRAIGDNEHPGSVGPVDLGGRAATAISTGTQHTCARLDDGSVRCWGYGAQGRLGLCSEANIGDDESPASVGPIDLGMPGIASQLCGGARAPVDAGADAGAAAAPTTAAPTPPPPGGAAQPPAADQLRAAVAAEQARRTALRACRRDARRKIDADRRRARRLRAARRAGAERRIERRAARLEDECARRHGRTPGPVRGLTARPLGNGRVELAFRVPASDGEAGPAARGYLIRQSRRPIRSSRDFARAPALCKSRCSFDVDRPGGSVRLTVINLRRGGRYYYAVAARDNVSGRVGPRSATVRVRVR